MTDEMQFKTQPRGLPDLDAHLARMEAWSVDLFAVSDIDLKMSDGSVREGQFGLLRDIRDDARVVLGILREIRDMVREVETTIGELPMEPSRCRYDG